MNETPVVQLTDEACRACEKDSKKLWGTSQLVCDAQFVLKVDAEGSESTDEKATSTRLGESPLGPPRWTLRWLVDHLVELKTIDSIRRAPD